LRLYDILGIEQEAAFRLVQEAYKRLALEHHPDKNGGETSDTWNDVRAAFVALSDDHTKSEYDRRGADEHGWDPFLGLDASQESNPGGDGDGGDRASDGDASDGDASDGDASDGDASDGDDGGGGRASDGDDGVSDGVTSGEDPGDGDHPAWSAEMSRLVRLNESSVKRLKKKVSACLTATFATALIAHQHRPEIRGAIRRGLSESEREAMEMPRKQRGASETPREAAMRKLRKLAMAKERVYYTRLFLYAYGEKNWGFQGDGNAQAAAKAAAKAAAAAAAAAAVPALMEQPPLPHRIILPPLQPLPPPQAPASPYVIYVLQLRELYRYVGRCLRSRLLKRLRAHLDGSGAQWTRVHPPVEPLEYWIYESWSPLHPFLEEDLVTKREMITHGIGFVRGGSHCGTVLSPRTTYVLRHEFRHGQGKCFRCEASGHHAADCPARD
jgi:curved DNA-binding protein CbpA